MQNPTAQAFSEKRQKEFKKDLKYILTVETPAVTVTDALNAILLQKGAGCNRHARRGSMWLWWDDAALALLHALARALQIIGRS